MPPALLETDRLSMSYPGTRALDVVSLSFEAGRVGAVVGRNGAGKSTLVKILSGAVRPTEGEVRLAGETVELRSPAEARARGIATVHQELSLVPGLSVAENVLLGRFPRRRGIARAAIDWRRMFEEARAILQGMQVDLDVRAPVARLSLAQRQMVEIARAVSAGARAVLFDEPTAGLGRAEARTLLRLVRSLAQSGVAVVYVTHRLGELHKVADSVTVLRDGRLAATIPASEATSEGLVDLMYGEDATAEAGVPPRADAACDPEERWPGFQRGSFADPHESEGSPRADCPSCEVPGGSDGRVGEGMPSVVLEARLGDRAAGETAAPVLEVEGLGLGEVLRDVSFVLRPGEILGIAGMLGSGRTELLMCLFGATRADRGRIVIRRERDGGLSRSVDRHARQRDGLRERSIPASACRPGRMRALGFALVPEDRKSLGLVLGLSTLDNACLASYDRVGRRGFISKGLQRKAVAPIIRELSVAAADLDAPVSVLSGGNQQKIVIGKWLLRAPRILLCDEPTRGIDVRAKHQVFEILRTLRTRGIATIVVSSELEELIEVCDRILILRGGTIAAEVTPPELSLERLFALCMGPSRESQG